MALNEDMIEYYKLVRELGDTSKVQDSHNKLTEEIITINNTLKCTTQNLNKGCQHLNAFTSDTIKARTCSSVISLGKENVPLIVSVKQLSDSVFCNDIKGCDVTIEEKLKNTLEKVEDNCYRQENLYKSFNRSIENMDYTIKAFKKLFPQEKEWDASEMKGRERRLSSASTASLVSEISSFLERDVVTSSPIKGDL